MKINSCTHHMIRLMAIILPSAAFAIEAPADNSPPPPAANGTQEAEQASEETAHNNSQIPIPRINEQIPFLGVLSSPVPEMLLQHLGLKPDAGVIVASLVPDSPAAKAGLTENDIITKVGDSDVASAINLTDQVRAHKPGDVLHLEVIQKGKPVGIDVTLGTRPNDLAQRSHIPKDKLRLDGIPKDLADRIRGAIEGRARALDLNIEDGAVDVVPQMDEAMREMRKRVEKAMEGLDAHVIPEAKIQKESHQSATFSMNDGQGMIELKQNDGSRDATVRDPAGKIVWTGPWETDQDKAAAPKDVRDRLDRLNIDEKFKGPGIRLKFNGNGAQEDEAEDSE